MVFTHFWIRTLMKYLTQKTLMEYLEMKWNKKLILFGSIRLDPFKLNVCLMKTNPRKTL